MTVDTLRGVLLWSGVINYAMLALWALLAILARGPFHRVASWYGLSAERFDAIQYGGILGYKIAILMLNFVPYIALRIVG